MEADEWQAFQEKQLYEILKKESAYFYINKDDFSRRYEIEFLQKDFSKEEFNKVVETNYKNIILSYAKKTNFLKALVVDTSDEEATISFAGLIGKISLDDLKWAKERLIDSKPNWRVSPKKVSDVLKVGMVLSVKFINEKVNKLAFKLFQVPQVQGAALAIDHKTNEVLAMVGGTTYLRSHFNRSLQSLRQPGSAFKPFVYAAAIKAGLTPSSILFDSPEALDAGEHELSWKPRNYDGKYLGPITLRTSLEKSRNVTTIKLAHKIGVSFLSKFLKKMYFDFEDKRDLSIALGSQGITLFDLVKRYSFFLAENVNQYSKYLISVKDFRGNDLSEKFTTLEKKEDSNTLDEQERLAETTGTPEADESEKEYYTLNTQERFIVQNLLKGVIQYGTGKKAKHISKEIGGKTGTTSDYVDAWFVGFSDKIVLGTWAGFDKNESMGFGESGGKAALPIWIDIMKSSINLYPTLPEKETPEGIVNVLINKASGKLADLNTRRPFLESYIEGSEPGSSADIPDGNLEDGMPEKVDDEDFLNL